MSRLLAFLLKYSPSKSGRLLVHSFPHGVHYCVVHPTLTFSSKPILKFPKKYKEPTAPSGVKIHLPKLFEQLKGEFRIFSETGSSIRENAFTHSPLESKQSYAIVHVRGRRKTMGHVRRVFPGLQFPR